MRTKVSTAALPARREKALLLLRVLGKTAREQRTARKILSSDPFFGHWRARTATALELDGGAGGLRRARHGFRESARPRRLGTASHHRPRFCRDVESAATGVV